MGQLSKPLALLLVLATFLLAGRTDATDRITRKNGRQVEGRVLSVDEESVVVQTARGRVRFPRSDVATIEFDAQEPAPPPLKVEIRNVHSDDSIDVYLEDELVIRDARKGGEWVDLTSKLKTGNNRLALRIHNERGGWAYQLSLRINGKVTRLACGSTLRPDKPCNCCGKQGYEQGVIDDLPPIWIYFDRELGVAEVIR